MDTKVNKNVAINAAIEDVEGQILDNSIDLLLTDPPYNISIDDSKSNYMTWEGNTVHSQDFDAGCEHEWDAVSREEYIKSLDTWTKIWYKKLRPNGQFVIFIADKYISDLWVALENNGLTPKRVITWKKTNAVPFNRKSVFIGACEFMVWGIKEGRGKKPKVFNATLDLLNSQKGYDLIEAESFADKVVNLVYKHARQSFLKTPEMFRGQVDSIVDGIFKSCRKELVDRLSNMRLSEKDDDRLYNDAKNRHEQRNKNRQEQGKPVTSFKEPKKIQNHARLSLPNFIMCPLVGQSRIHPTEKPVQVLKYFISVLTNEGDIVLDTFAGSGSTGEAALELNRNYILIEREKKFFKLMQKRLKQIKTD